MNGQPRPRLRAGLSRPRSGLAASRPRFTTPRPSAAVTSARITPGRRPVDAQPVQPQKKSSRENGLGENQVSYFAVLYTKRSKKKRKSWLDGYIIVQDDRRVELQNEDGKKVASERYKPLGGLKEGNTLEVASYELEVQNMVAEDDYISGRLFIKPSIQSVSLPARPKSFKARVPFKPLRPKTSTTDAQAAGSSSVAMHDPNAPEAFVLLPAKSGILQGKKTVPVVLDPFLGKRMRPHQREGVKFLYSCVQGSFFYTGEGGQGAILADEMGLGKSLQAIALIWTLLKQSPTGTPLVKKAVIVCPASLVQNWINEVKKWLGFDRLNPVEVASGSSTYEAKEAIAAFINGSVRRLLVISYEMFRSYSEQLYKSGIGLMVCDEGHRLKSSHGNKTIEALRRLPCRRRVILTGTPVQNDLEEFFAVCDFVNPGCFNSLVSFRSVFSKPIISSRDSNAPSHVVRLGEARAKELGKITSSFVLRRTSNVLANYLPAKTEIAVFCRLQPQQETEYKREARSRYADVSTSCRFSAALSAIMYLRKICCHPNMVNQGVLDDGDEEFSELIRSVNNSEGKRKDGVPTDFEVSDSSKMQVTVSICQESLAAKDKVILVSNYTSTLDLLQKALFRRNIKLCRLDGNTPVNQRGNIVRRFNEGTIGDVFLLSAKAGGVGLNLIGANRLILFDPDWNPATDLQAMARVWRDGQKKPVFVYRLLSTGTIEEKIFQRQLFKGELQSAVDRDNDNNRDAQEAGMERLMGGKEGNFNAEELRDLFQYNPDHKYCDTLEVLQRSLDDTSTVQDDNRKRPLSLFERFREYKDIFETQEGCRGEIFCEGDPVLDKALNGDIATHGIVSYLYTKTTDNLSPERGNRVSKEKQESIDEKAAAAPAGFNKKSKAAGSCMQQLATIFESDSDGSGDDDPECLVLAAMRRKDDGSKSCGATNDLKRKPGHEEIQSAGSKRPCSSTSGKDKEKDDTRECAKIATTWDEALDELGDDESFDVLNSD